MEYDIKIQAQIVQHVLAYFKEGGYFFFKNIFSTFSDSPWRKKD